MPTPHCPKCRGPHNQPRELSEESDDGMHQHHYWCDHPFHLTRPNPEAEKRRERHRYYTAQGRTNAVTTWDGDYCHGVLKPEALLNVVQFIPVEVTLKRDKGEMAAVTEGRVKALIGRQYAAMMTYGDGALRDAPETGDAGATRARGDERAR